MITLHVTGYDALAERMLTDKARWAGESVPGNHTIECRVCASGAETSALAGTALPGANAFHVLVKSAGHDRAITVLACDQLGALHGVCRVIQELRAGHPVESGMRAPQMQRRALSAAVRHEEEIPRLFDCLIESGMNELVIMPNDFGLATSRAYRNNGMLIGTFSHPDCFMFGSRHYPKFRALTDPYALLRQRSIMDALCAWGEATGIRLTYLLLIPKFPVNTLAAVRKCYPEFLGGDGRFDPASPAFREYFRRQLEEILACYPAIKGFEFWMAEGAGATIFDYNPAVFAKLDEYLPGWLDVMAEIQRRHGVEIDVFTHHYTHSVATRLRTYQHMAKQPAFTLMEDLTWCEEFLWLAPGGHLDKEVWDALSGHKVKLNFLLDTEYMGQGVIPTVFPRWIKSGVEFCNARGLAAMGRIMWWDGGQSLDNYNRANIHFLGRFCWDPAEDAGQVLHEYLAQQYGPACARELTGVFAQCEALVAAIFQVNGVGVFDHSAFPRPEYLHTRYMGHASMKCIDDLFQQPGTKLYDETRTNIVNVHQWRQQLRLHAVGLDAMLAPKDEALARLVDIQRQLDGLRDRLPPSLLARLKRDFTVFADLAAAMKCFIAIGYHDYHGDCHRRAVALIELRGLAQRIRQEHGVEYYFRLADRLNRIVEYFGEGACR